MHDPTGQPRAITRLSASRVVVLLLAAACVFVSQPVHGQARTSAPEQSPQSPRPYWVNIGIGPASKSPSADNLDHIHVGFGISYTGMIRPHRFVGGRILSTGEFDVLADKLDRRIDLGLLYGVAVPTRRTVVSAGAGLGLEYFARAGQEGHTTVAVPFEVQTYVRLSRSFGVGVSGIANVNGQDSFVGFLLGVQFGRLSSSP